MAKRLPVKGKGFSLIFILIIVICSLLPWLSYDGKTYSLFTFFQSVYSSGGVIKCFPGGTDIYAGYFFLHLAALTGILSFARGIFLVFNIRNNILDASMRWSEFIYGAGFLAFQGYSPKAPVFITAALVMAEFIVSRYCEDRDEIHKQYEILKEQERKEKAERKRRLYFPGKYPTEFYHVIRENFMFNWKNYVLFILSAVLSSAFLTAVIGMAFMLRRVHSWEEFLLGSGMQRILLEAAVLVTVITVFLTAYVFSYYIKTRIDDYRMFTILGIRNKTLSGIIMAEYVTSLACSFFAGFILGSAMLLLIRHLLVKELGENTGVSGLSPIIYLIVLAAYLMVLMISTAINYESYSQIRASFSVIQAVDREKRPRFFPLLQALFGLSLMHNAILLYADKYFSESIKINLLFIAGMFLFITRGKAFLIKWGQKWDWYYFHSLFKNIPFYYRFRKNSRNLFLVSAIHFLVLSVFIIRLTGNLTAEPVEKLYPYDFVCMAYEEDRQFLQTIKEEYEADIQQYPMVRVTSVKGSTGSIGNSEANVLWPQSEHAGISESTYLTLCRAAGRPGRPLGLTGNDIHIVYQQDSSFPAHPSDWLSSDPKKAGLRIGQPLSMYRDSLDVLYPVRNIKSEEINILTGMLNRGMQENLIVFPDDYFQKVRTQVEAKNYLGRAATEENRESYLIEHGSNITEGATDLYLITDTNNNYDEIKKTLLELDTRHPVEFSWDDDIRITYDKEQMIKNTASERYTKEVVYAFVIVMLTACALFLTYIKFSFETKEMCRRYDFLDCMGMHAKEQRRTIRREMRPFAYIPLIIASLSAATFTAITFSLREFNSRQSAAYLKYGGTLFVCYCLLHMIWMIWLQKQMIKKVEKNRVNTGRQEHE